MAKSAICEELPSEMPTLISSRFLRAPPKATGIADTPPTSATMIKPTKAGVIPKDSAADCTDPTNTSLTIAISTVTTASVTNPTPMGHGSSSSPECLTLTNMSLCVFSENSRLKA